MKITIYDVAKEANVSIATVSKVINKNGRISEKTKRKVYKVMEELNYQPSLIASALMGKQTKTVGLFIPDLANPFFSELARSIEDRANELGYNVVICNTDYLIEKENKYISLLKQKSVDGFILASGFEKLKQVEELMNEDIPVVIVARDFPMFPVNAVAVDDFMGGFEATAYLIDLGHKDIGIIARDVWSNRERLRGYREAMEVNGLDIPDFKFAKDTTIAAGEEVTNEFLKSKRPPTAVFACNDLLAIGAIQAAKAQNVKVPDQLSVVGFDNTMIAGIVDPPLTTIAQPIQRMGQEVVNLMIKMIKGDKEKTRITLLPELVVRESTKEKDNNDNLSIIK